MIHDALHAGDLPRGVIATIGNYDGVHRGQRSVLGPFYERFNRAFGRGTEAYSGFTAILVGKMRRSLVFIVGLAGIAVLLADRVPSGFVPEEDQGFLLVNLMLPDAASLERTDAVMRKVRGPQDGGR